jgi:hypothetical protein
MSGCNTAVEIMILVKGEDQSYRKKHLVYEEMRMSHEDPIVKSLIEDAKKECKFEIDEIIVKTSF